jgi:hypothetical protein
MIDVARSRATGFSKKPARPKGRAALFLAILAPAQRRR